MELRQIQVDRNLREHIHYKDMSFPLDIWTDDYNMFVDHTLNCHWHDEFEFGVMLEGKLDYYINGEHLALQKGEGVFVNANTMHMATQSKSCADAIMYTIVFPASLFTGGVTGSIHQKYFKPVINSDVQGFKIQNNTKTGKTMLDALNNIYAQRDAAFGYELECMGQLGALWGAVGSYMQEYGATATKKERNNKQEEKAKDILTYIHAHYAYSISIDELAKYANISRSECFRCFKRFTNKKPVEYINEYRLAHAAQMLKETSQSITQICTACGFSSSSYFAKLFKEKFGQSPLKYRQSKGF